MQPRSYDLKKIIIVGVIMLIIAGIAGFLLLRKKTELPTEPRTQNDLFPYGTTTGTGNSGGPVDADNPPGTTEPLANPITMASGATLRQITNYPVTNFYAATVNKTISEPKLDEKTGATIFISSTIPSNILRWNVKQTGILMDAEVSSETIVQNQATSTQIPAAEELWFGRSGNVAVYRTYDDAQRVITSYRGIMPNSDTLGYCSIPFTQTIAQGTKSNEAKELQLYLNYKINAGLTTDGAFGAKSVSALKQFQKDSGFVETGKMDPQTIVAVNTDCGLIRTEFEKQKSEPKTLTGSFMTQNIVRGAVSPDGSQLFYMVPNQDGISGTVVPIAGGSTKNIFTSSFTEWMPQWFSADTIGLTTLASREADGYLYFLNATNGNFKKIMGPIRGLTTLVSPDGKHVLYSNSGDARFSTRVLTIATGAVRNLDLSTLPAKCVWRDTVTVICGVPQTYGNNSYPDAWYQGVMSFSDSIWSINTETGATKILVSPVQKLDMIKLQISTDKNYLYFVNKTDETLWSLRLES